MAAEPQTINYSLPPAGASASEIRVHLERLMASLARYRTSPHYETYMEYARVTAAMLSNREALDEARRGRTLATIGIAVSALVLVATLALVWATWMLVEATQALVAAGG